MFENITVILPSLNPDYRLNLVVDGVMEQGFKDILIINDGSDEEHLAPFCEAEKKPGVTVLTHEKNKGKGRGLKTAFQYVLENRPDSRGVVTIDGDNQHHPEDIAACTTAMLERKGAVLGCRDFSEAGVPWKSRCGNNITKFVFRVFCGIRISDTQTGLRAFPASYLPALTDTDGERYEYETNVLLEMNSKRLPVSEVKIRTLYEDEENSTSHFHPFRDSMKIYRVIFKYLFSSGAAAIIDNLAFLMFSTIFSGFVTAGFTIFGHSFAPDWIITYSSYFLARAISSAFNYKVNKEVVFKSGTKGTLLRYYLLAVAVLIVSAGCVSVLSVVCGANDIVRTLLKIVVDSILFLVSFRIQKNWVYK